ncbi:hypothetical protein AQUCO_00100143v1 [Aquilegia coerulea]|uniref:Uncharacterized protein n=1 Tax=Aquilegia coerulea TaxID=218851 RepID=A0A2G5F8X1_AQUCA|nr:hypothetical protein AQUCO_00100143v1 [Aquilegia coerulea]
MISSLWSVWCARNNLVFRDEAFEVQTVVRTVKCMCWSRLHITKQGAQKKQGHKITDLFGGWDSLVQDRL